MNPDGHFPLSFQGYDSSQSPNLRATTYRLNHLRFDFFSVTIWLSMYLHKGQVPDLTTMSDSAFSKDPMHGCP